ncbi:MAG: HAMP domain-containing histidine kinase, partial [Muribaculaceae bacterium]|nr:HAMP domain-containing histidine kinase [Muribaculaceae bacterium]
NMVIGEAECEINTDSDRLTQILVNLLTNAMKFTRRGYVTFGYEVRRRDNEIYFYVRDTGTGIAPEDIGKLFTRFTKLNNFIQGTGLGLSISKSIVERLGGKIGAESAGPGKGSLFWFTLPYLGKNNNLNK